MIPEIAAEHGSSSGLEKRGSTPLKAGNGYPDFYAFTDLACYSIAGGINSTGIFTKITTTYPTDITCYVECGKDEYFALGQK